MNDQEIGSGWEPDIPEGWEVATDEIMLQALSIAEYNRYMSMNPELARQYKEAIVERNKARLEAQK